MLFIKPTRPGQRVKLLLTALLTACAAIVVAMMTAGAALASGAGTDTLGTNQALCSGQSLYSANGEFMLQMQGDGNLVLYRFSGNSNAPHALWASGTGGHTGLGLWLAMQADGNLVIYSGSCGHGVQAYWADVQNAGGHYAPNLSTNPHLVLQTDGNLVLSGSSGLLWTPLSNLKNTTLYPGDYLKPNWDLTSSNGHYEMFMQQSDGNLVTYVHGTPTAVWASKTHDSTSSTYDYAIMQSTGDFGVWDPHYQDFAFDSNTSGHPGATATLNSDGSLSVSSAGVILWSSSGATSDATALQAAALAQTYNGQTTMPSWFVQKYSYAHIGPYWSGYCESFITLVAYDPNGLPHYGSAHLDYENKLSRGMIHRTGVPPAGAIIYWDAWSGGTDWGHIAISIGNGMEISTVGWSGAYPIAEHPYTYWASVGLNYLGWAMPY